MADLSVPFVDEVAMKGMEEGNAEVSAGGRPTWLDAVGFRPAHALSCWLQMLEQLHDPGRDGTEVRSRKSGHWHSKNS